ncbi:hypothetical protein EDB86DRAFT_1912175 [Lactarius hatsudake]|nr:hypothetical protein EDB86DRAFT_1912175 [Lactarius hatsudake]
MKGVETSMQDQGIPRASDTKAIKKTTDSTRPEAVPSPPRFVAQRRLSRLRSHPRPGVLTISQSTSDFSLFAMSSHNSMKDSPHDLYMYLWDAIVALAHSQFENFTAVGPLAARTVKMEDLSVVVVSKRPRQRPLDDVTVELYLYPCSGARCNSGSGDSEWMYYDSTFPCDARRAGPSTSTISDAACGH